jgi:hypothetical protein
MTVVQPSPANDVENRLDQAVIDLLHRRVLQESERDPATGCLLHGSGRIRMFGGIFVAKKVLWEYTHGHLDDDVMLVRRCAEARCVEPGCHIAQTRRQHGAWLGGGTGWRHSAVS